MDDYCRRFYFALDMNGDGVFTISDVWLMVKFIWFLPAKAAVALAVNMGLGTFFEIDCGTGESWGGGIFSLVAWLVTIPLVIVFLMSFWESVPGPGGKR